MQLPLASCHFGLMTVIGKKPLVSIPQPALRKSQSSQASQQTAFGNFPSVKQDLLGDPFREIHEKAFGRGL